MQARIYVRIARAAALAAAILAIAVPAAGAVTLSPQT